MAFVPGYTAPSGLVVPDAGSTDNIPNLMQGLLDGSNGGNPMNAMLIAGPFASLTALTNAYSSVPDAQKPFLARVTALGLYQWVPAPYSVWIPALGSTQRFDAPTQAAVGVTSSSTNVGITGILAIAVPPWPILVWATYRVRVAATSSSTGNICNTYILANSTADGYQTLSSLPGSTSVTLPYQVPGTLQGGASTFNLRGGLEYVAGSVGMQADGTDTPRTRLSAVVSPFYANVGGTPF